MIDRLKVRFKSNLASCCLCIVDAAVKEVMKVWVPAAKHSVIVLRPFISRSKDFKLRLQNLKDAY